MEKHEKRNKILLSIATVVEQNWDRHSPLLLGYSGGVDSKALLYALLELGYRDALHIAHVDHGWRSESAREALALAEEAQQLGVPFYTQRLELAEEGNPENNARQSRFAFFHAIMKKVPFQAVLLAHQAEDVGETVVKRVFEGANLPFLGGMEHVSVIGNVPIWRPMLFVRREEIVSFLQQRNLSPLIDATNSDPSYLRARMRQETLPFLTRSFGKEIGQNLLVLSQRSFELKTFLDKYAKDHPVQRGPWGVFYSVCDVDRLIARHILQREMHALGFSTSRNLVESVLDAGYSKKPNLSFPPHFFVDRGFVFLLREKMPQLGLAALPITPGTYQWGDWKIVICPIAQSDNTVSCAQQDPVPTDTETLDWKAVWSGSFSVVTDSGFMHPPPQNRKLRCVWNAYKVPSFLRDEIPVVYDCNQQWQEFLSGACAVRKNKRFALSVSVGSS